MSNQERDDLTLFKGIGSVRQKWLADVFGVYTFADLADLSIDQVEAVAREEGVILSRNKIASWIEQANDLVASKPAAETGGDDNDTDDLAGTNELTTLPVSLQDNDDNGKVETWEPIASFVVEFQERTLSGQPAARRTAVHHMETDIGTTWPGIADTQLCQWMGKQAKLKEVTVPKPPVSSSPTATAVTVQITRARLQQQPNFSTICEMAYEKRPFLGHVSHEKPMTLAVELELSTAATGNLPGQLQYQARCHVQNLTTEKKAYYLEMKNTPPSGDETVYQSTLPELQLDPGIYKLGILVSGKPPLNTNYFELPKLNVL